MTKRGRYLIKESNTERWTVADKHTIGGRHRSNKCSHGRGKERLDDLGRRLVLQLLRDVLETNPSS